MSTPFTSGKGSSNRSAPSASGGYTSLAPFANQLLGLAGGATNIAGEQVGAAQPLISGGTGQYEAGLTGQLTPAQSALTDFTRNEMNVNTASNFANMGLGGSSMATQGQNANALASLAQTEGILTQDELLGLEALKQGEGFLSGGVSSLGEAGNLTGGAARLTEAGNQDYLNALSGGKQALNSLSGQSSGGGGKMGGIGSWLGNLFGGSGGTPVDTGIGSILGGDTGLVSGAAAPGAGFIDTTSIFDTGIGSSIASDAAAIA